MSDIFNDAALDQLFRTARTQNAFQDRPVEDSQLRALYDLLKWAQLHADIIRRFGRFPHRNAVLGRDSTPEEKAFLDAGGFSG